MRPSHPHQAFSELLPFFANGTLTAAERTLVAAHLSSCLVCRAELAQEQVLLQALRDSDASERLVDDGFERVMLRVRGAGQPLSVAARPRRRRATRQLTRRVAAAALLGGVVLGGAQFAGDGNSGPPRFHTLSQDRGQVVGADIVYVIFNPAASVGAIHEALGAVQGDVVSGPNRDHVFSVRVAADGVAAAVSALKSRAEIRFVAAAAPQAEGTGVAP